jgi:hypothetical protein
MQWCRLITVISLTCFFACGCEDKESSVPLASNTMPVPVASAASPTEEDLERKAIESGNVESCYVPDLHPMSLRLPFDEEKRLIRRTDPLIAIAQKAVGLQLDIVMQVDSQAHNYVNRRAGNWELSEQVLEGAKPARLKYKKGLYVATASKFQDLQIDLITFSYDTKLGTRLIDREVLGCCFNNDFCLIDAEADGTLNVIVTTAPGASGGGQIDIFQMEEDGSLERVNGRSQIHAAYTAFALNDFDLDGRWEVETREIFSYEGAIGSYQFTKVYGHDPRSDQWRLCTSRFPAVTEEQRSFYKEYLFALNGLAKRSASAGKEPWERASNYSPLLNWRGKKYRKGYPDLDQLRIFVENPEELARQRDNGY